MFKIEFRNFDGDFAKILREIAEWIEKYKPINPQIVIVDQSDKFLRIDITCEDYLTLVED